MTMTVRFIDAESKMREDALGLDIYMSAIEAINNARKDGQESGKHSPDSWELESIENQLEHANEHSYNAYCSMFDPPNGEPLLNVKEMEHALYRLAIGIALYKKVENGT